ncbi:hypothetical protein KY310_02225 [Candidatus Woesearchaeota archaeon]|nr:hypothetical protein [Candidatus Woesearchaeota archaeon]
MDAYIARLERFLGPRHTSTQGFTIIRDLLRRGEAPPMGVFYAGRKRSVFHDLVLYSIGEDRVEFCPVPTDKSLLKCLENATEVAEKIQNPPRRTDHLIVLSLDEAAIKELQATQAELNGNGGTINGSRVTYVSVPLVEQARAYEDTPAIEQSHSAPEKPLSTQAEAIRQSMLARYTTEKAAVEKLCGEIGMPEIKPSFIRKQAP